MNDAYLFQQEVRILRGYIYYKVYSFINNRELALKITNEVVERINTTYNRRPDNSIDVKDQIEQMISKLLDNHLSSIKKINHATKKISEEETFTPSKQRYTSLFE